MPIDEIFPNPTVKTVAYEVKFPNLFYIESKIGDLQIKLIERFPDSAMLLKRSLVLGETVQQQVEPSQADENTITKIWQFKSPLNHLVNIQSNSLLITSEFHKTYNQGDGDKFREVIEFVVGKLLEELRIPLFTRIGLRYVDECPVPIKNSETYKSYYNTTFNLDRFSIEDAIQMQNITAVQRGQKVLRYIESLQTSDDNECRLILDFDGYQENVPTAQYLAVTDDLHQMISNEFQNSIKNPLYDYMRQPQD